MLAVVRHDRDRLLDLVGEVAGTSGDLKEQWLSATDAVVLPQESALHFDEEQCDQLASAFIAIGVARLVAVPLESDDRFNVYRLDATSQDLADFSSECGSLRYLLAPDADKASTAILCTTADYFVLAGSCEFVSAFAGDIPAAQRRFMEFVEGHFKEAQGALAAAVAYTVSDRSASLCAEPLREGQGPR